MANNFILCRQQGWNDIGAQRRCRWGGGASYRNPPVDTSQFGFSAGTYTNDGTLEFSIQTDISNVAIRSIIQFDLVDWQKEDSVRELVGQIPNQNSIADDDTLGVLIRVSSRSEFGQVESLGFIRRPMGLPKVKSGSALLTCPLSCLAPVSENPHAECRGPQELQAGVQSAVSLEVSNIGPGAIYELSYERTTTPNPAVLGNTISPDHKVIPMLGDAGVIMPGQTMLVSDHVTCLQPANAASVVTTATTTCSTCSGGLALASRGAHLVEVARTTYSISVSRYDPAQYFQPNFLAQYDPFNPATYIVNPSHSILDPRKTAYDVSKGEVSLKADVSLEMAVVPPH